MRTALILLTSLVVVHCQKRNFSGSTCPTRCICFRKTVRCMHLELTEIPKVSLQTTMLDLRFNRITDIPPGTFKGYKNLRSLMLNNNQLTNLRSGAFSGLPNLRHLYLYKNRIKYIDSDVFQGLNKLEHLYLNKNEIDEFKAGTFSNLPSLDRLFLHNNKIKHVPNGSFSGLPKLTRLRLDSNALICDCKLAWLSDMLKGNKIYSAADCKYPSEMYGKPIKSMDSEDFHCETPKITKGPDDLEISWGETAMFKCEIQGDSSAKIVWMRDDQEINMDNTKYEMMNDGSLVIKDTKDDDSGYYECMAKSDEGVVKSRPARMVVKSVTLNQNDFNGTPRFTLTPQNVTTSINAEGITLHCQAEGNPEPTITWSRNGIILSMTSRHYLDNRGTLVIRPVRAEDYGTYRCDAQNQYGRISAQAEVILNVEPIFTVQPESVTIQPGESTKLECVAVGSPQPEITWFKEDLEIKSGGRIHISSDATILELQNAKTSDSGLYICEARNVQGYREVSAEITVRNLKRRPAKLVYKPYDVQVIFGSTIEIPCKADGDPQPGVQWRKDGSPLLRNGRIRTSINGNLYIVGVTQEDQGRYECIANNEYGTDSASGYVSVKEDPHPSGVGIGDKFVRIAFVEATDEVDRAINKTIDNLFNKKGPHNPAELFRLIRFPDAPARELARAAEVYERTLVNIRKHVSRGMHMNATDEFNYRELLSPEHLELVAKLSGCVAHRQAKNCTDMCYHAKYRSVDGMCNNLQHPTWGASLSGFRRILKPIYENGFSTPVGWDRSMRYYGYPKPSSRLVSTTLISTDRVTPDNKYTHMLMQWGQFLDHDLDHALPSVSSESWDGIDCKKSCDYAAPCYPIDIPPGDPRVKNRRCIDFIRTSSICGSGMTSVFFDSIQPREQINQLTSFIDASQVYGFSDELADDLRDLTTDDGLLRVGIRSRTNKPLLPFAGNQGMDCRRNLSESNTNCFLAGDIRVNEQVGLIAMHTVWLREHNRVARELKSINPHWDGDTIYQEARKVVGAAMQHITYKHWLPYIIGEEGMKMLGEFKEYNPNLNPSISNVFATAALRFGHTLINPILHRFDENWKEIPEGHLPLHKAFFSPWRIVDEGGIDPLLRGLITVAAKLKKPQENLNSDLTEQLFTSAHAVALDLAAMNIHRARDHAIPGYVDFRKFCNMTEVDAFEDLTNEITDPSVLQRLRQLYGHPGNIDVFVGGILEDQVPGGKVGPLFRCLLVEQFKRLRDGDRFWYENPSSFKPEQLVQIKQYSLAKVLCDNADNFTKIGRDAFILPELQNGFIECAELPAVDFRVWTECCGGGCQSASQFNTIFGNRSKRDVSVKPKEDPESVNTVKLTKEIADLRKAVESYKNEINNLVNRIEDLQKKVYDSV